MNDFTPAARNEDWKIKLHPDVFPFIKLVFTVDIKDRIGEDHMFEGIEVFEFTDKIEIFINMTQEAFDPSKVSYQFDDSRSSNSVYEGFSPIIRRNCSNIDVGRIPLTMTYTFDKMNIVSILRVMAEANGLDMEKLLNIRMPHPSKAAELGFSDKFDFKRLIFVNPKYLKEMGYSIKSKGNPSTEKGDDDGKAKED